MAFFIFIVSPSSNDHFVCRISVAILRIRSNVWVVVESWSKDQSPFLSTKILEDEPILQW